MVWSWKGKHPKKHSPGYVPFFLVLNCYFICFKLRLSVSSLIDLALQLSFFRFKHFLFLCKMRYLLVSLFYFKISLVIPKHICLLFVLQLRKFIRKIFALLLTRVQIPLTCSDFSFYGLQLIPEISTDLFLILLVLLSLLKFTLKSVKLMLHGLIFVSFALKLLI